MKFFVRTVVTGFGLALGAALYRKLAKQLGVDDAPANANATASAAQAPSPSANN